MSREFINGTLAEKARLAQTLVAEVLSGLPDDLLEKHGDRLHAGAMALNQVHFDLRERDKP